MTDKALTVGQVAASVETKLDRIDFTEEERSLLQAALQAAKLANVEIQVVPKPEVEAFRTETYGSPNKDLSGGWGMLDFVATVTNTVIDVNQDGISGVHHPGA